MIYAISLALLSKTIVIIIIVLLLLSTTLYGDAYFAISYLVSTLSAINTKTWQTRGTRILKVLFFF